MTGTGQHTVLGDDGEEALDERLRSAALTAGAHASSLSPGPARAFVDGARRRTRILTRVAIVVAVAAVVATLVVVRHPSKGSSAPTPEGAVTTATTPPWRGQMAAMAYFPPAKEVVLFGGDGASTYLNDTWVFGADGWTELHPATSPPARGYAGMAYDPALGELVLYGGCGYCGAPGYTVLQDTWAFNGSDWHELRSAKLPSYEPQPLVAWDSATAQLELLGPPPGYGPNPPTGDFGVGPGDRLGRWTWSPSGWTWSGYLGGNPQLEGSDSAFVQVPGTTEMLYYVYSPYLGSCIPRAGSQPNCDYDPTGLRFSQSWTWDGRTAVLHHPAQAPQSTLLAADSGTGEVVAVAGRKVFGWTGANWVVRSSDVPDTTVSAVAYDPALGELVLFGGNPQTAVAGTWLWNGATWSEVGRR